MPDEAIQVSQTHFHRNNCRHNNSKKPPLVGRTKRSQSMRQLRCIRWLPYSRRFRRPNWNALKFAMQRSGSAFCGAIPCNSRQLSVSIYIISYLIIKNLISMHWGNWSWWWHLNRHFFNWLLETLLTFVVMNQLSARCCICIKKFDITATTAT